MQQMPLKKQHYSIWHSPAAEELREADWAAAAEEHQQLDLREQLSLHHEH